MSDAIVLDVLSASPVQLDVGDADPIAREEIAALDARLDTAEGDISTLGTTVDGIDARVEAIEADYVTAEDVRDALGGEAPALVSGSSRAMLGDPETASWMERTTAADGAALIESICGNTVVQGGSLLPVRMEGVETTGFNQIDLTKVHGVAHYNPSVGTVFASGTSGTATMTGENPCFVTVSSAWGGLSIISDELIPGETYRLEGNVSGSTPRVSIAVLDASYAVTRLLNNYSGGYNVSNSFTPAATERYLVISVSSTEVGTVTLTNFCLHISDPSRNGTYEPYWSAQRTIPAATYFPQGLRSAGSVRDELTATQAITRVGERAYQSGDESDASVITDGTVTHYALATPTTTPIDPPIPMSYRTGAGGTERVMVASGTTSAPPIFATRYPLDPTDLAASIAPVDGPTAKTNHQVGDLLMLGFTLCKATQVIVTGETIEIGTNVTKTTVAAELAALS